MTREEIIEDIEEAVELIEAKDRFGDGSDFDKRRKGMRILARIVADLKREKYLA